MFLFSISIRHPLFEFNEGADVFFFFSSRRRHTRFKCDWSSDVCSSDLAHPMYPRDAFLRLWRSQQTPTTADPSDEMFLIAELQMPPRAPLGGNGYIATSDRKSVV